LDQTLLDLALPEHSEAILIAGTAVLALVVGSFLNVVILRLPVMMDRAWRRECQELLDSPPIPAPSTEKISLAYPPSTCPGCGHRIRPLENIPVLSYVLLGGRCSACRKRIPLRYPIVEALTALLSVIVVLCLGLSWHTAAALCFTWALVALTVIDLDHQLLPDSITLPLLWAGLITNQLTGAVPLQVALWGAVAGYLSLWSVYWAFKLITGKEGMGHGDFKLLAALGAWLGWMALPTIVLLSSLLGALAGIGMMLFKGMKRDNPFPFGPFLAGAGWVTLLWGAELRHYWP
jgi:leader peptidase (prepilin peptidase)/N-methyltransferase